MFSLPSPLMGVYFVVGPLAWTGMFFAYAFGRAVMNRLQLAKQLPDQAPHVTILIPAKDEAGRIETSVRSALAQSYPAYDVLVIDDRSTDATGKILDHLATQDARLRVLHIQPMTLPAGWLGKSHALSRGVEQLPDRTRWILFMDSDVTLMPNALTVALSNSLNRKYDALSLLTSLQCHSFMERLILPVAGAAWSFMFLVARTNDDRFKQNAAANGQFFLIRRDAYEAVGGHAAVHDQITEDVELMRLLKHADFRVRLCFGNNLAATRMHASIRQMIHGWGRIFSGTARRRTWRMFLGIAFIFFGCFSVWPALAYGLTYSTTWLAIALLHWSLMTGYAVIVYGQSGQSRWNALFFPAGQAALLVLFGYGIRMCRTGRVWWRDTHYASWTPMTRNSSFVRGVNAEPIGGRSLPMTATIASDAGGRSGSPLPEK